MSSNIDATRNFINNLMNQQIVEQRYVDALKQNSTAYQKMAAINAKPLESPNLFDELTQLLDKAQYGDESDSTDPNILNTVNKLLDSGVEANLVANLLMSLAGDTADIIYTRTDSFDPNITLQNKMKYMGGDLASFLAQTELISRKGGDVNKYVETVIDVFSKSDYDDLRRFISVTDTVIDEHQDLSEFFDFAKQASEKSPEKMESLFFTVQTLLSYGSGLDNAIKIVNNMETNDTGKDNIGKLNIYTIACKKAGFDLSPIFQEMANSGNTMGYIDSWAAAHGMKFINSRDNSKFNRVENIDVRSDMVIHEGDSAALFAQAISSTEGVLDPKYLYWSSLQTGSLVNGTSYLDLSKLPPGEYEIYVKVGNYNPGTDTAKRKVIVLGKDNNTSKGNNGLGDQKDSDNTIKGIDTSNPGHNKLESVVPSPLNLPPVPASFPFSDKEKMERLKEMCQDFMDENQISEFSDGNMTLEKFADLLNRFNSKKSEEGEDEWAESLFEMERSSFLYKKSLMDIQNFINKQLVQKAELMDENTKKEKSEKKSFQEFLDSLYTSQEMRNQEDQIAEVNKDIIENKPKDNLLFNSYLNLVNNVKTENKSVHSEKPENQHNEKTDSEKQSNSSKEKVKIV